MPPSEGSAGALAGIRVLDFGQYVAGPLAAMMLADQGAEVIRIDPPGGPRWKTGANVMLQRGKQSFLLDLKQKSGLETARRLADSADVLIENFRPGVMARLGLGAAQLSAANPRLIYCALPGFPADDKRADRPGWEGAVSAASGLCTPSPRPGESPTPALPPMPVASNYAAFLAVNAIMAALLARLHSGAGQTIEIPLLGAAFEAFCLEAQRAPMPSHNAFHAAADNRFQTADGKFVQLLLIAPRHLERFVKIFLPDLAALGDAARLSADSEAGAALVRAMSALFLTRAAAEWDVLVNEAGIPLAICQSRGDFLRADAQARAAGAVIALEDPELGATLQLGFPVRLSRTPPAARPRKVMDAANPGFARARNVQAAGRPTAPDLPPLCGVTVLDMSQILAGPTAGRILAQFGAEVIKINKPGNWIIGHLHFNSGKQSVLLDIGRPEGRRVLSAMLADADVFLHNLPPDSAKKLRVTEAEIRADKPDIIYASMSAYTNCGPRENYRGWEPVGQAITGMQTSGGRAPHLARFPLCDFGAGHLLAFAILLALWHRAETGEGQHAESSLMQAGAYHQAASMIYPLPVAGGAGQGRSGLYETADGFIYVHLQAGAEARLSEVPALDPADLQNAFRLATSQSWCNRLAEAGIAAQSMRTIDEAMEDERTLAQGWSRKLRYADGGEVRLIGGIPRMSASRLPAMPAASPPGRDTRKILGRYCNDAALEKLFFSGIAAEALNAGTAIVW
jgi:crotonobetainyl-CoA:carnitine CoA-transferase CaiB-like acyl-CoA transferase